MKKIIALVLVFALVLVLTACTAATSASEPEYNPFKDRFDSYKVETGMRVYVDRVTSVCYLWEKSGYGGGLTVMLDTDGSPLIYMEE